jgi:hypothetical protein
LKAVLILSNLLLQLCTDLAPPDLHTKHTDDNKWSEASLHKDMQHDRSDWSQCYGEKKSSLVKNQTLI